jgi:hypothetical protein
MEDGMGMAVLDRDALLASLQRFISGNRPGRVAGVPDDLTGLARRERLRELARRGVDLTLLQQTPPLSPTERVERMRSFGQFLVSESGSRAGSAAALVGRPGAGADHHLRAPPGRQDRSPGAFPRR